jgi:hypothetical protein
MRVTTRGTKRKAIVAPAVAVRSQLSLSAIACALKAAIPAHLVDALTKHYVLAKEHDLVDDFHGVESNVGLFCEAAIRICASVASVSFKDIGDNSFKFEVAYQSVQATSASAANDSIRLLIPHILKSAYTIRSRRGVDHVGLVQPNHIDARIMMASGDWAMAEFTRLYLNVQPKEAQAIIEALVERKIPIVEKVAGQLVFLEAGFELGERIVIALYAHVTPLSRSEIVAAIKAPPASAYRKFIELEAESFIVIDGQAVHLTSLGKKLAESLILSKKVAL